MKVFAEKSNRARKVADDAALASAVDIQGEDRLAQGFELLFGAHIKQQRQELERRQADMLERLGALEARLAEHAGHLEELLDKSRAGVEREQAEYRRRSRVEDELRQTMGELRASVTIQLGEVLEKTKHIEAGVLEELEAARNAHSAEHGARYEELFRHLEETLQELKSSKLERRELAGLFATLAQRCAVGPGEVGE